MTDERKEQIRVRVMELMEWGVELSASVYDVCKKYGIELPESKKESADVSVSAAETPAETTSVKEVKNGTKKVETAKAEEPAEESAEEPVQTGLFGQSKEE